MAIYDTGPFYNFLNAVTTVSVDLTNTTASSSIAYITLYTFTNRSGLGNESYPLGYPTTGPIVLQPMGAGFPPTTGSTYSINYGINPNLFPGLLGVRIEVTEDPTVAVVPEITFLGSNSTIVRSFSPGDLSITSFPTFAYCANITSNSVSVFETTVTDQYPTDTLITLPGANALAYADNTFYTSTLYVGSNINNTITPVNANSYTIGSPVPVGNASERIFQIGIPTGLNYVYIVSQASNTYTMDATTLLVSSSPVSASFAAPTQLAVNPNSFIATDPDIGFGGYISFNQLGGVQQFRGTTSPILNTVTGINTSVTYCGVAITSDGSTAYAVATTTDQISFAAISTASNTQTAFYSPFGAITPIGTQTAQAAVSPDNSTLYVLANPTSSASLPCILVVTKIGTNVPIVPFVIIPDFITAGTMLTSISMNGTTDRAYITYSTLSGDGGVILLNLSSVLAGNPAIIDYTYNIGVQPNDVIVYSSS